MVTWSSNGQDGDGCGVYARRYDATGVAMENEFRVNTTIANDQVDASVRSMMRATSSSPGPADQDGGDWGIYAQRYNAAGVAQGGEFQVNTHTTK